jgi:superoxide dismutase, Cu-Zn family
MQGATGRKVAAMIATAVVATATVTMVPGGSAGAAKPLAEAELRNAAGDVVGTVRFEGKGHHSEWVRVELALPAGAPGADAFHGFHVHAVGACVAPFTTAAGHWNLTAGATHGRHTGDLPSILVAADGTATARFATHRFDVNQLFDADGSAVILHAGVDNFGNVPIEPAKYADPNSWYGAPTGTANTGDAGARYACGVVRPA